MPSVQLLDRARQGDVAAMEQLLNQALAHKQIQVVAQLEAACLDLVLTAASSPDQQTATILICRELQRWHVQAPETLNITGQACGSLTPAWTQTIALTPSSPASLTLDQAARGPQQWPHTPHVAPPRAVRPPRSPSTLALGIDPAGWNAIAAGLGLALLVLASGQVTFLLSPLITLVHELGHTCAAWAFGYPAIPAFDFLHGGGITFHALQRWPLILAAIYAGFGYLFYRYWSNPLTAKVLLAIVGLYTLLAFTPGQDLLITLMGHGFELLFAGIFLYRALSGYGCRIAIERPLYGMLSWFTLFYDIRFAHRLMFDAGFRQVYELGKGGVLDHDFVRLAHHYLNMDLAVVAFLFLVSCVITPVVVMGLYRDRAVVFGVMAHLLQVKPVR